MPLSPTADYPSALHTAIAVTSNANNPLGFTSPTHTQLEEKQEKEILEIQKKLGLGSSPVSSAVIGSYLRRREDGTTAWIRDFISVKDYGTVGDGVTDDTAAIAEAIAAAIAANIALFWPSGTYRSNLQTITASTLVMFADKNVILVQTSTDGLIYFDGGFEWEETVSAVATATVNMAYASQTTNNMRVSQLTMANARTLVRGDVVKVVSDDELVGANPGSAGLKKRSGEYHMVLDSTGVTATLSGVVRDIYSTSVRVGKLRDKRLEMYGFEIKADPAIFASASGIGTDTILIRGGKYHQIRECVIHDLFSKGIKVSAYMPNIEDCTLYNIEDKPTINHYGYAIEDQGSYGMTVTSCLATNVRHAFTTTTEAIAVSTSRLELYGRSIGARVTNCGGFGTSSSTFDTHEETFDAVFTNCKAYYSQNYGFTWRGYNVTFTDCDTVRCKSGFGMTGIDTGIMNNCRAIETNTDGLVTQMATSHATASTVQTNVQVNDSYIEFGKNNTGVTSRGALLGQASYTTKIDIKNTKFKLLGSFTGDRAFFYSGTVEANMRDITVDLSAGGHISSDNVFVMLFNDNLATVRANGIKVYGGANPAIMQLYKGGSAGNTSIVELLRTEYYHDTTAPTVIISNFAAGSGRLEYKQKIGSTLTSSAYATQVAAASGATSIPGGVTTAGAFPGFGNAADNECVLELTGSGGALTMANFRNGWFPGQRVTIRNNSNGAVTIASPSVTISAGAIARFAWTSSSTWMQI